MYLFANWKMNPGSIKEAEKLAIETQKFLSIEKSKVVIFPPFLYLKTIKEKTDLALGAQNCFWEQKGSYTGEVSPEMLKSIGCQYAIIGHSERRKYFKEKKKEIKKKVNACLSAGIKPVLCVGETKKEREDKKTKKVLESQLSFLSQKKALIAYEPRWAIGTGKTPPQKELKEVLFFIKKAFKSSVLYGGSVDGQNADLFQRVGFDGVLVGGASLKPREFAQIAEKLES